MGRFRADDLVVETKPDLTPVTEADTAVEAMLRERLERDRPGDAILGEELGTTGAGRRRWIVDPIDGTKGYARGIPVWATLIALEVDGELVVGVVSAPALGSRWSAARGAGAQRDGEPVTVSKVARIEDAHLAYDSVGAFESVGLDAQFLALARRCWRVRGFGDFWSDMLVADGAIDIAVEVGGLAVCDRAAGGVEAAVAWHDGPLRALAELGELEVKGVSVAAMVPSLAAVDGAGVPITPGLLYGDDRGRTGAHVGAGGSDDASGGFLGFVRWLAEEAPGAHGYWPAQAVANHAL